MTDRLHYGTPAKVMHWLVVALLMVQFPIGWFMPDVHGGSPGNAMTLHISCGITLLVVIVARLIRRITHRVVPESSQPLWQRVSSETVHWLLYAGVFAATLCFAERGDRAPTGDQARAALHPSRSAAASAQQSARVEQVSLIHGPAAPPALPLPQTDPQCPSDGNPRLPMPRARPCVGVNAIQRT